MSEQKEEKKGKRNGVSPVKLDKNRQLEDTVKMICHTDHQQVLLSNQQSHAHIMQHIETPSAESHDLYPLTQVYSPRTIRQKEFEFRKALKQDMREQVKIQIELMREECAREFQDKLEKVKQLYLLEMKSLKEQLVHQRQLNKSKEAAMAKLTKVLMKQELQMGTEDLSPFLDLYPEPQLSLLDMAKVKILNENFYQSLEMQVKEYQQLKSSLKELEMQNKLLVGQLVALKKTSFREVQSVVKQHQQEFEEKQKSAFELIQLIPSSLLEQKGEEIQNAIDQKPQVFASKLETVQEDQHIELKLDEKEEFKEPKVESSSYEERYNYEGKFVLNRIEGSYKDSSISLHASQELERIPSDIPMQTYDRQAPSHSSLLRQLGIPPRPKNEILKEMELAKNQEMEDKLQLEKVKLQQQYDNLKEQLLDDNRKKDILIYQMNQKVELLKQELEKALHVLKKNQDQHSTTPTLQKIPSIDTSNPLLPPEKQHSHQQKASFPQLEKLLNSLKNWPKPQRQKKSFSQFQLPQMNASDSNRGDKPLTEFEVSLLDPSSRRIYEFDERKRKLTTPPYLIRAQYEGLKYKKFMEEEAIDKTILQGRNTARNRQKIPLELKNNDLKTIVNSSVQGFNQTESAKNSKDFHEYVRNQKIDMYAERMRQIDPQMTRFGLYNHQLNRSKNLLEQTNSPTQYSPSLLQKKMKKNNDLMDQMRRGRNKRSLNKLRTDYKQILSNTQIISVALALKKKKKIHEEDENKSEGEEQNQR